MTSDNIRAINGQIAGVSLSSFLQMIEMEQKTCTIKVFTKKNLGYIFFLKGALIDSNTIRLKHLDALYDILSWNDIVIEVEENISKKHDVINLPLMHILIESARQSDETQRINSQNDSKNVTVASTKNIRHHTLSNENFCLEIGIKLLVNFDDLEVPFQSTLVGIERGKYLLLKSPGPFGRIEHDLFKAENLIVKSLYKGTIYAFRSRLIDTISTPSKLMFIEYPQKVEHHELRLHKRFKCSIVAQTEVNQKETGGVIENISLGGCLCIMETDSNEKNYPSDLLNDTLPFRCHFPGSSGEISFMGEIKNARHKSDEIAAGIKFIYPDDSNEIQGIVNNYIQLIEYSSENV